MIKKKHTIRFALGSLCLGLIFATGCQSTGVNSGSGDGPGILATAIQNGTLQTTAQEALVKADDKANSRSAILNYLEAGTLLTVAGDPNLSLEAFDKAEQIVNEYEEQAEVKLGSETLAIFTSQATLPYRGREYDKIMLNTYKALNQIILDNQDAARVELNRVFQRQENAVLENQKKIEEALDVAERAKRGELTDEDGKKAQSYDVGRAEQDPKFAAGVQTIMSDVDSRLLAYTDYVNPFSVWLDGVFFSQFAFDAADLERARKSFERVRSMSPGTFIEADYQMVEAMANGAPAEEVTYVVFSTGRAPTRSETRVDIPLFLVSTVSYAGAALPKLEFHQNYYPTVQALTTDGNVYNSERVCSMDAVISRDFKNEWKSVLTKTLIGTATKAIAGYMAEKAVENQDWKVRLAMKIANVGLQSATNKADIRTWASLPKEYSYIRIPTPEDGTVTLSAGAWSQTIQVTPGTSNMLYVRSVNNVAAPQIKNISL